MGRRLAIGAAVVFGVVALGFVLATRYWAGAASDPDFFESEIAAFDAQDARAPFAPGGIVFVGSSSIRFWETLERDMAPLRVLNRGFGGAHFEHVLHSLDRTVLRHAPRGVVVYVGDNDLAAGTGKTAETVAAALETLVARIRAELPDARIFFLTIKPSPLRWDRWPEMSRANARITQIADADPRVEVIDIAPALLGPDGSPRDDAFRFDGLHLSESGYAGWAALVRPRLRAHFGEGAAP